MTLFLDTCIVIDALRDDRPHCRQRINEAMQGGQQVAISSLVFHELTFGAMISAKPDVELALIDSFVDLILVEPWSAEDAISAARVRADLKKVGSPIGVVDALIAGQALNRGWNVVTSNVRDFIRIDDLSIIDWSDPAEARELDRASWLANLSKFKDPK